MPKIIALKTLAPANTEKLFMPLARKLIALLRSLTPGQWLAPTCYPKWKARDIASPLLQTGIGRLSRGFLAVKAIMMED